MNLRRATLVTVLLLLPGPAVAQLDIRACEGALAKDLVTYMSSDRQRAAWFRLYADSAWALQQHDGSMGVVVMDVPIGASASQFKETARKTFSKDSGSTTRDLDLRYAHAVTSDRSYDSYDRCVQHLSESRPKVTITPKEVGGNSALLILRTRESQGETLRLVGVAEGVRRRNIWSGYKTGPNIAEPIEVPWLPGESEMSVRVSDANGKGAAILKLFRAHGDITVEVNEQPLRPSERQLRTVEDTTPNLHEVRYKAGRCAFRWDKYCGARTVFRYTARNGYRLEFPTTRDSLIKPVAQHPERVQVYARVGRAVPARLPGWGWNRISRQELLADGKVAEVELENSSWGAIWRMSVWEVKEQPPQPPLSDGPRPIFVGEDFVAFVPTGAESIVRIKVGRSEGYFPRDATQTTVGNYTVRRVGVPVDGKKYDVDGQWIQLKLMAR